MSRNTGRAPDGARCAKNVTPEICSRLEALNIQWTTNAAGYAAFTRGNLIAVARCAGHGVTSLGSTGIMTDNGLAYLAWRGGQPMLAAHGGNEIPATAEQAEAIRHFSAGLKSALGLGE